MSELQTFTVDSEALSLLSSVTSRESATDPEELPSAESWALASRAVSNNRPHAIYLDSAHVPRAHVRAPHMGAFFIRITGALSQTALSSGTWPRLLLDFSCANHSIPRLGI
eukprot:scaffold88760_cov43-Attheya_sp.AAC.1